MAKTRKTAEATHLDSPAAPEPPPAITLAAVQPPALEAGGDAGQHQARTPASHAAQEPRQAGREGEPGETAYAADPHAKITVPLSNVRGGPAMHLLRSHRFKQMQILFDGAQPDDKQIAMLKEAGWTDRSESEAVWTKQIDQQARWQSVAQLEREFRDVANAGREARGLTPTLERLGAA